MQCARDGCPFSHKYKDFSKYQQHCCNACALNEHFQTKKCHGAGKLVQGSGSWNTFTIPRSWMRNHLNVTQVVEWYETQPLDNDVMLHWESFANFLDNQKQCDTLRRNIQLSAVTSEEFEAEANQNENEKKWDDAIDLTKYEDIDARRGTYYIKSVTGVDYCVQSCLIMQYDVIDALWDAARRIIENTEITRFAFVCQNATHRSVACCLLLAILVFPRAHIVLTTEKTYNAAIDCGLIGLDA